ncbi:hypothetical protein Tco_0096217 [Tanacetum coccineum]
MATCHHLSGATWHFHCSPPAVGQLPPDHWSTTVVNGGQRRSTPPDHRSTAAVNDGQRWRTTVDHRRTTGQLVGRVGYWAGYWAKSGRVTGLDRVWIGSGSGLDRHVASPEWATCHNMENPHPRQAWGSNSRPLEERLCALPLCQA